MKNIFKYFICGGSVIFTVLSMVVICVSIIISNDNTVVVPQRYLHLFLFAFIVSLGNTFKKITQLSTMLSAILHGVCYVGGFVMLLLLSEISAPVAIVFTAVYTFIYCAIVLISVLKNKRKPVSKGAKNNIGVKQSKVNTVSKNKSNNVKSQNETYTNLFS